MSRGFQPGGGCARSQRRVAIVTGWLEAALTGRQDARRHYGSGVSVRPVAVAVAAKQFWLAVAAGFDESLATIFL